MESIRIVDRDRLIIREIDRWRVCLGRHIKELAGFTGQRACDRRLRKLINAGYIKKKRILYGISAIYQATNKARLIVDVNPSGLVRLEHIKHDITVTDTAIHFIRSGVPLSAITTEKQLHMMDGFSQRKHRPDFLFTHEGKTACVEVELSLKDRNRFERIMKDNFINYDRQIWVVQDLRSKIARILKENRPKYPNIELLKLSEVYLK